MHPTWHQLINKGMLRPSKWRHWIKTLFFDLKYGARFLGIIEKNSYLARGRHQTTSSDYDALQYLFSKITLSAEDVLVDVGCGKGRVFNHLLNQGVKNTMLGIEVDRNIASQTQKRLQQFSQIKIIPRAIEDQPLPSEGSIYYLFNPFSRAVLQIFAQQLKDRVNQGGFAQGRPIVLYYNCCYLEVFAQDPFWKVTVFPSITSMNLDAALIEPVV